MAGSYKHCVTDDGLLRTDGSFTGMIENLGDAWEAIEEMYGMIWLLAGGNGHLVEDARQRYDEGIELSPGVQRH